jgi:hypothetical protein
MSFTNAAQQQEMIEAARMEQAKRDVIAAVYADPQYEDFVRCEANDRAIIEISFRWTQNPDVLPTKEIFDEAMRENPDEVKHFARRPTKQHRALIISEYLKLLAAHSRQDSISLRSEERRLQHLPLSALRQKLDELKRRQGMSSMPVSALKQIVRDGRPDQNQFPQLPKTIWNGTSHVLLNAAAFRAMSAFDLKRYGRIYGTAAVNERIAQG